MNEDLRKLLSRSTARELTDDILQKRANAISKFTQGTDSVKRFTNLIKFIYSLEAENDSINEFRQLLISEDPDFSVHRKNFELKLLSLAVLKDIVENQPLKIGASLSLALVNCFGFGLREKSRGYNIEDFSEQLLNTSFYNRSVLTKKQVEFPFKAQTINKLKPDINQFPALIEGINAFIDQYNESVSQYSEISEDVLDEIGKREQILKEELDILWWVFSNKSIRIQKSWKQIIHPTSCFMIGEELASQVNVLPGPRSYAEIIKKILNENYEGDLKATSLKAILSKASKDKVFKEWKVYLVETANGQIDLVTPVHYIIMKSLEENFNLGNVASVGKINITHQLPPNLLAAQMYRECVYIRSIQK